MDWVSITLPYQQTGYFSRIITDYLKQTGELSPFYSHPVSPEGFRSAIEARKDVPTQRKALVDALTEQYADVEPSPNRFGKYRTSCGYKHVYGVYCPPAGHFYRASLCYLQDPAHHPSGRMATGAPSGQALRTRVFYGQRGRRSRRAWDTSISATRNWFGIPNSRVRLAG